MDLEDCPECGTPVLDHDFARAMACAHARAGVARVLLRHALTTAEETVDGGTWTHATDARNALENLDQALLFMVEAHPALKSGDED